MGASGKTLAEKKAEFVAKYHPSESTSGTPVELTEDLLSQIPEYARDRPVVYVKQGGETVALSGVSEALQSQQQLQGPTARELEAGQSLISEHRQPTGYGPLNVGYMSTPYSPTGKGFESGGVIYPTFSPFDKGPMAGQPLYGQSTPTGVVAYPSEKQPSEYKMSTTGGYDTLEKRKVNIESNPATGRTYASEFEAFQQSEAYQKLPGYKKAAMSAGVIFSSPLKLVGLGAERVRNITSEGRLGISKEEFMLGYENIYMKSFEYEPYVWSSSGEKLYEKSPLRRGLESPISQMAIGYGAGKVVGTAVEGAIGSFKALSPGAAGKLTEWAIKYPKTTKALGWAAAGGLLAPSAVSTYTTGQEMKSAGYSKPDITGYYLQSGATALTSIAGFVGGYKSGSPIRISRVGAGEKYPDVMKLEGYTGTGKILKPTQISGLTFNVKKEPITLWTGLDVGGRPVLGKAPGEPKLSWGMPKTLAYPEASLAEGIPLSTKIETRFAGEYAARNFPENARVVNEQVFLGKQEFKQGTELLKQTYGVKSKFIDELNLEEVRGYAALSPKGKAAFRQKYVQESLVSYGSTSWKAQSKGFWGREAHDFDIMYKNVEAESKAREWFDVLKPYEKGLYMEGAQIYAKPGVKLLDIHSNLQKELSLGYSTSKRLGYEPLTKKIKLKVSQGGKVKSQILSEGGLGKGASIFTLRKEGFAPASYREKDIGDFLTIQKTLIESKRSKGKGRNILNELEGTLSPLIKESKGKTEKVTLMQAEKYTPRYYPKTSLAGTYLSSTYPKNIKSWKPRNPSKVSSMPSYPSLKPSYYKSPSPSPYTYKSPSPISPSPTSYPSIYPASYSYKSPSPSPYTSPSPYEYPYKTPYYPIPKIPMFGNIPEGSLTYAGGGKQANRYQASLIGLVSGYKQSKAAKTLTGIEIRYPIGVTPARTGGQRKTKPLYLLAKGKGTQAIRGIERQLLYKTGRRG